MHEMAIVTSVVDKVVEYAQQNDAAKVNRVTLVVGDIHDIVDALMESCFQHMARGTVAEGASLELARIPFRAQCSECNLVYPADIRSKDTLVCPDCGSSNFRIFNGNEFMIRDIEIVKG